MNISDYKVKAKNYLKKINLFRAKPRKITSPTGSKDLQTVNISLRVLSRPSASSLPDVHMSLGTDYEEKVSLT